MENIWRKWYWWCKKTLDELHRLYPNFRNTRSFNNATQGKRDYNKSTSISLEAGKYIVLGTFATTAVYTSSSSTGTTKPSINISSCLDLDAYSMITISPSNAPGVSVRHYLEERFGMWYCDFDETTTVTITAASCCNESENSSSVSVQAVKIGWWLFNNNFFWHYFIKIIIFLIIIIDKIKYFVIYS